MRDRTTPALVVEVTSALGKESAGGAVAHSSASLQPISIRADRPSPQALSSFMFDPEDRLMVRVSESQRGQRLMLSPMDNAGLCAKIQEIRDRHMETIAEALMQELSQRPDIAVNGDLTVQRPEPNLYRMSGLSISMRDIHQSDRALAIDLQIEAKTEPRGHFATIISDPVLHGEVRTDIGWDDYETPASIAHKTADEIATFPVRRQEYFD